MRTHIFQILKATAASIIFSLAFVLVFTLVIKFANLNSSVIKPVNQVFKTISIAAGGLIFIRGEKGLIKGLIYGFAAVALTYLLFGLISGGLSVSWKLALELALGVVSGGIAGVIGVNIKKRA